MSSIAATVEQIALYLGPPWKFNRREEPSDWRFEIIDGTGRGLFLRKEYNKPRFQISGLFPRDITSPYPRDRKSIGVSATRPPKDIAADISRRLMPDYLPAFERAKAARQQQREAEAEINTIADALIRVTGGRTASYSPCHSRTVYFDGGEAEIYSPKDVRLKLHSLTAEQAITIAASLKGSAS